MSVFIRRGEDTERDMPRGRVHEDVGRGSRDASTSSGTPRITSDPQELGEGDMEWGFPWSLQKELTLPAPGSWTSGLWNKGLNRFLFLAIHFVAIGYSSPRKLI